MINRPTSAPCVAIVDPYSSGAMLAEALRSRGARCVAVHSSRRIPAQMRSRYRPESFMTVIEHDGDLVRTSRALQDYAPTCVVAGFESGVELADQLSERLSLPGNGTALSEARRDKYLMGEAVRSHGLLTARQFRGSGAGELLEWIEQSSTWPAVLKPARSVASDSVFCCGSPGEVRRAHETILSRRTVLGDQNEVVLAQELLRGTEYAVDVVSYNGKRKVTAYWQYSRPAGDAGIGYDAMALLPYDGERQRVLRDYASRVLDALGIMVGPAHCEVMWTERGPTLVEVGARMSAGVNAVLSRECGGLGQLDETVSVILDPDRFLASLDAEPVLERRAVNVFLMPPRPGRLTRIDGLDIIRALPTLHSMSVGATPGQRLPRVAGIVTLVSTDPRALERDVAAVRAVVRAGLFDVETAADESGGRSSTTSL